MNFKSLIPIVCAGSMAWAGNNAAVLGPVTGYIFDAQLHAIRPMMGIPGAAYLGTPVVSGMAAASVSPDGSAAIAVEGGRVTLYQGLGNAKPLLVPLNGGIAADFFAWAPSGTAAAVYSSAAGQAQVFSNLLAASPAGVPVDLSGLAGRVAGMAFDGQHVILAVSSPNAGGIYIATTQSAPQLVASAVSPAGVALAGTDLYFTDSQAQQVWQVRNYATAPAPVVFAADMSLSAPAALQISADGARLYVANVGNRTLGIYDVASRTPMQSISLSVAPTTLDRFGDASVFVLNAASLGSAPLFVLTDRLDTRAVYFVPGTERAKRRLPLHYKPQ